MRSIIRRFDTYVTDLITSLPSSLKPLFLAVTMLGDPIVVIVIGVAVAIFGYVQQNMRLVLSGVVVWATLGVGAVLKLVFARNRPPGEHASILRFDTFSFPSGHSSGSVVAYGLLAYVVYCLLPAPWNGIGCVVLAVIPILVGVSRIYLGVHYPSDVVAGWLLGLAALAVIIIVLHPLAVR